MEAKNIEQYFGTLQQSTVEAWRKHLKVSKKSQHETLNDFYEDIVDVVDALIEDYMSIHGKVEDYENLLSEKEMDALEYLETLREFTREGADELFDEDDTELFSDVDNILSVMDTAIYKLKELEESKSYKDLKDFINESLVNEASKKYEVVFLSTDSDAWDGFEEGELDIRDLEEQMYEAGDIKRISFNAPNDNAAVKKAQKELDKWDDPRDCIAASIYLDNADNGDIVETIFSKAWMEFVK